MLHMMGQSEYGLYGTANSFISYLSILSFGVGGAYIRYNARCRANNDKNEEDQLNGMFLTIFTCLSVLVLAGGLAFIALAGILVKNTYTPDELYKLRVLMLLLTINTVVTFVFVVVMMALQAYEQFGFIRIVLLIMGVITPIINIVALKVGGRAIAITFISLILSCLSYLIFLAYARRVIHMRFSFKGFKKETVKELFVFSSFLFINSITDQITFSTDNIVLSAVKGTTATAIYTVGSSFKNYFQSFSTSVSSVFAPQVNMIMAQNQDEKALCEIFQRVGRVQFYIVALVMIGYSIIGQDFIRMWAGEDYSEAFWIGFLLMLSVFVPSFQNIGIEIQKAMNMHKARSIVYFFIAILNVLITIPASIKWGGIGAAAATAMCMFLGTVVFMNWYYWKRIGLDIPEFWRSIASILPGFILPIAVGLIFTHFCEIDSFFDVLLAAVAISVTYGCSIWFFSMNEYEKNLIKSPLRKKFKR